MPAEAKISYIQQISGKILKLDMESVLKMLFKLLILKSVHFLDELQRKSHC